MFFSPHCRTQFCQRHTRGVEFLSSSILAPKCRFIVDSVDRVRVYLVVFLPPTTFYCLHTLVCNQRYSKRFFFVDIISSSFIFVMNLCGGKLVYWFHTPPCLFCGQPGCWGTQWTTRRLPHPPTRRWKSSPCSLRWAPGCEVPSPQFRPIRLFDVRKAKMVRQEAKWEYYALGTWAVKKVRTAQMLLVFTFVIQL